MVDQAAYSETFSVPRSALPDLTNVVSGAIDFGCSLVKAVFIPKEEILDVNSEHVTLHCLTFPPKEIDVVLEVLKSRAHFPKDALLRVTGVGCVRFDKKIQDVLGVKTVFLQEFLAAARGMFLLVSNCTSESLFYPRKEVSSVKQSEPMVEAMLASMRLKVTKNNGPSESAFPALMFLIGSGAAAIYINEEGKSQFLSGLPVAGRTFLGLSRLLVGTADYTEIMSLAEKGNPGETALLVRHMIAEDPTSIYGQHDPDEAIQPFGNVPNADKSLSDYSREDLAAGLVHMLCSLFFFFSLNSSEIKGINRYYICGNFPRAQIVRDIWASTYKTMFNDVLDFHFTRTGHFGAIGSLFTDPAEQMKYMLM